MSESIFGYKIDTVIDDDVIKQYIEDPCGKIIRRMIDTQERQIIDSLIALGWTPPKK